MRKVLFYAMQGEKMCFQHVLLNALDLSEAGIEVKIIFEGASVKLPSVLVKEGNKLFQRALERGLVAGICLACSRVLGVFEANQELSIAMLDDMNGHAGMRPFVEQGFEVISM